MLTTIIMITRIEPAATKKLREVARRQEGDEEELKKRREEEGLYVRAAGMCLSMPLPD
jgi:hypothetical protein